MFNYKKVVFSLLMSMTVPVLAARLDQVGIVAVTHLASNALTGAGMITSAGLAASAYVAHTRNSPRISAACGTAAVFIALGTYLVNKVRKSSKSYLQTV